MKRSPIRRKTRLRSKRQKPGVTGRPSLDAEPWKRLKWDLYHRAGGRCEHPGCRTATGPLDPHHLRKRSQGGEDTLDNLVLLCRKHHDQTDAAYAQGRLVIERIGRELRFRMEYAQEASEAQ